MVADGNYRDLRTVSTQAGTCVAIAEIFKEAREIVVPA
jgi:hypothetical protein